MNLMLKSKIAKIFSFETANTPKNNPIPENTTPIPTNIKTMIIKVGIVVGRIINITTKNIVKGIRTAMNSEII